MAAVLLLLVVQIEDSFGGCGSSSKKQNTFNHCAHLDELPRAAGQRSTAASQLPGHPACRITGDFCVLGYSV